MYFAHLMQYPTAFNMNAFLGSVGTPEQPFKPEPSEREGWGSKWHIVLVKPSHRTRTGEPHQARLTILLLPIYMGLSVTLNWLWEISLCVVVCVGVCMCVRMHVFVTGCAEVTPMHSSLCVKCFFKENNLLTSWYLTTFKGAACFRRGGQRTFILAEQQLTKHLFQLCWPIICIFRTTHKLSQPIESFHNARQRCLK